MAFYAGQLRHKIKLQTPTDTVDQYGRPCRTWTDSVTLYAKVADVSGREFYEASAYQMENVVTFTTRSLNCASTAMRIVFDGQAYEIEQINHLGYRGDFMQMKAKLVEAEANGSI